MFARIGLLALFFIYIVWIPVEIAWSHFCFNNYDLGIYAQTVQLIGLDALNPWLSTRDLHIFNDHFEPVHFVAAIFRNFVHPSLLIIRLDMIAILLAAMAPLWLYKRGQASKDVALCASALILFSPLILDAAYFPAHPGTWSLAPLAWMYAFILVGLDAYAIAMLLLIFMCKEEYPVVGFAMGAGLFYIGRRKLGSWFLVLSAVWFIGVFFVRPIVIGPADMYTQAVAKGSGFDLFRNWSDAKPVVGRFLEVLLPLVVFKSIFKVGKIKSVECIFVLSLAVFLGIRLVGGFWGNHRSAPVGIALAFVFLALAKNLEIRKSQKILFAIVLLVQAFPSFELGSRVWRGKSFKKHCSNESARVAAIEEVSQYLREHRDGAVLAQGNIVPRLVDLPDIGQIGATKSSNYRYFFAEKSQYRNTWPISPEEFSKLEKQWLDSGAKVLRNDEFVLLMEKI